MGYPILVRWHLYIELGPCSGVNLQIFLGDPPDGGCLLTHALTSSSAQGLIGWCRHQSTETSPFQSDESPHHIAQPRAISIRIWTRLVNYFKRKWNIRTYVLFPLCFRKKAGDNALSTVVQFVEKSVILDRTQPKIYIFTKNDHIFENHRMN